MIKQKHVKLKNIFCVLFKNLQSLIKCCSNKYLRVFMIQEIQLTINKAHKIRLLFMYQTYQIG